MNRIRSKRILAQGKEISAYIYFDKNGIFAVTEDELPYDSEYDAGECYVSAGFIDPHTHGGGGYAFEIGVNDVVGGVNFHLAHGTTSICPTISAAPIDSMRASVEGVKLAMSDGRVKGNIIGAHLEGPYLSLAQTGAQAGACITFPIEKDYSDTHLALEEGFKQGYTNFDVYGALGGDRFSHSVANLQTLCAMKSKGVSVTLIGMK